MKQISLFVLFLLCYAGTRAQNPVDILAGPSITMNCPDLCQVMHATYPKPLRTDMYSTNGIPYAPLPVGGTILNMNDDKFTTALPLGFDFCFFNNVYSQCYLADNGVLTFNSLYSGVSCNNNIQQTLPYFNSTFPDNAIFFLFMDVNPTLGGTIRYQTVGTAPFRKFVVSYENVKLFGNSCTNATSTFQVILYETTHVIETHISNKAVCDNNALNYANFATIGLQNLGATSYFTMPGKHAAVFTAANEAYRFAPSGSPAYTMNWKIKGDTILATNTDSVTYCPASFPYKWVKAELTLDCPPGFYVDSVQLDKPIPDILNVQIVQPFCANDSTGSLLINAVVNVPPATYSINNGPYQASNVFNGLNMGTYTLTVKDGAGCTADTSISMLPVNMMYLFADTLINPTCPDSNGKLVVSVTGGTPPYTFVWSNGDIGNMADSLGFGAVYVTVTDSNGCVQVFPQMLYFDSIPIIDEIVTNPVCGASNGVISISVTNGNPPYTLLWNTGDTTYSVDSLSPNNVYFVVVTDAIGCTGLYSHFLQDTLNTATDSTFAHTTCGLDNGSATVYADSGLAPYTYLWSPGGQTTPSVSGLPPGVYTCVTSDANGCTEDNTFTILPSVPLINSLAWSDANCDTSNGSIYITGVQNAQNGYTQLWSNGQTGPAISGLAAGTYWVTTFSGGCQKTDTVTLINDGKPQLYVVSYDPPHCYGEKGSAVLGGTLGTLPYKYSLDGITYQSSAQLTYLLAGVYTIYITDANSCINSTTVTFTEPPLITLNYTADTVTCFEDKTATVHFSAGGGTPGYEYRFNHGLYSSDTMYDALEQGIYPIEVRDANNCVRPFNILVSGPAKPMDVLIDKQDLYCLERNTGSFTATITGGWPPYTYTWSDGSTGLSFDNLGETKKTIYVTDSMGCEMEKYVNVDILGCCHMVMPNAFTPNGDGLNDYLKPIPVSTVNGIRYSIYDRWGHLVYYTQTVGDKWDGTDKGTLCDGGTYFYYIEYTCPQEFKKFILKGDATLIR